MTTEEQFLIRAAMRILAARGGSRTTAKQTAARKANAAKARLIKQQKQNSTK